MEEWKPINNLYSVSNEGRVRSEDRCSVDERGRVMFRKGKILTPGERKDGYLVVNISDGKNRKTERVHRLVACAFILNPNNLPWINHKYGNRKDNRVSEIEWCTPSMNNLHAFTVLNRAPVINKGAKNGYSKPILDFSTGIYYECAREASSALGIKQSTLSAMLRGQNPNFTSLKYC